VKSKSPKPPDGISPEAKTWWKKLTSAYVFSDPDSIMLLNSVMECFDRMNEARTLVAKEGLVATNRLGEQKPHPGLRVEAMARDAMHRALKQLSLDPPSNPVGRPYARGGR
jgi:P27 family predicted phage terminase small subunit